MSADYIIVAGDEREFPSSCCQSCGEDLSGVPLASASDDCPSCGRFPHWMTKDHRRETRLEVCVCESCDERFVRRVHYETTTEECGDRERTKVTRRAGLPRCGACDEVAQARRHERAAASCRERAARRRESQRRMVKKHADRPSSSWEAVASKARVVT